MNVFGKRFKISASFIVLLLFVVLLVISILFYFNKTDSKLGPILASIIAGLLVASIQFIIAWQDFKRNEKFSDLELIDILDNRDDRTQYEEYIKRGKKQLDVMGVTAYRFFNDFADTDTNAPENARVLINALSRGVKVRILLPSEAFLPNDEKKADARRVREKFQEITKRCDGIELKYFDHTAAHSICRVDETIIVGPVFPDVESKYTPALHLKSTSPIALKYLDYFDSEWAKAKS